MEDEIGEIEHDPTGLNVHCTECFVAGKERIGVQLCENRCCVSIDCLTCGGHLISIDIGPAARAQLAQLEEVPCPHPPEPGIPEAC